jgi:hypothetical protein
MSRYSIPQAFFMSFYSQDLYRDVARFWSGKAFFYLFLLLALCWIAPTLQIQRSIEKFYADTAEAAILLLPVMEMKKGVLHTPENRPYFIKDPGTNNVMAIIDTSGQYTTLDGTDAMVLITANKFISHQSGRDTRIHEFTPALDDITVTPDKINQFLKRCVSYTWLIVFTVALIGSFLYRLLQALLYSLLGKIFSSVTSAGVNYGMILSITLVALTPTLVLSTVLDVFHIVFPFQLLSYFVLSMLYIVYGIRANRI